MSLVTVFLEPPTIPFFFLLATQMLILVKKRVWGELSVLQSFPYAL